MTPFRKNKNPCKQGFLPMSVGNGLPGGRGMHAAPVCKVNPPVGQTFHFLRHASGPILATGRTQPSVIPGRASGPSPLDAMAERAFHAISRISVSPGSPTERAHVNTNAGARIDPAAIFSLAGEWQAIRAEGILDTDADVSFGWRVVDWFPAGRCFAHGYIPSFSAWRRPIAQAAPCSAQRRRQGEPIFGRTVGTGA